MRTNQEWVELADSLERYKGSLVRFKEWVRATEFRANALHNEGPPAEASDKVSSSN